MTSAGARFGEQKWITLHQIPAKIRRIKTALPGTATTHGHLCNITLSKVGVNPEVKNELHTPSKRTDRHTYTYNQSHLAPLGFCLVLGPDKGAEPRGYAALTSPTALFPLSHISLSIFTFCCIFDPSFLFKLLTRFASIAWKVSVFSVFFCFDFFVERGRFVKQNPI